MRRIDDDMEQAIEQAGRIVREADRAYWPSHKFALFSGGHDSLVSTHFLMEQFDFDAVVHLSTGIGVPRTRRFVKEVCDHFGWDLKIYRADEDCGQVYEQLVVPPEVRDGDLTWIERGGFPGPTETAHRKMYNRLKERPVEALVRDHKQDCQTISAEDGGLVLPDGPIEQVEPNRSGTEADLFSGKRRDQHYDRIMLGTGVYADESNRRAQLKEKEIDRTGAQLWVNPLLHWSEQLVEKYREQADLKNIKNPVYSTLGMSGECTCSCFAKDGEKQRIGMTSEQLWKRIDMLEQHAFAHGYRWGYEEGKPQAAVDAKKHVEKIKKKIGAEDDIVEDNCEPSPGEKYACATCGAGFWEDRDLDQFRQVWGEGVEKSIREAFREINERYKHV